MAQVVREYIDERPQLRSALALGIVNLSALARLVQADTGIEQEEAVAMAIRRYEPSASANDSTARIQKLLRRCRLEIHTGFAQLAVRPDWRLLARVASTMDAFQLAHHPVYLLQGREALTVLADERVSAELGKALGREVLDSRGGYVGIIMHSQDDLQEVPGFLAHVVGALAARDVNLVELVSCNRDTLLMVEERQLAEAADVLESLTRG